MPCAHAEGVLLTSFCILVHMNTEPSIFAKIINGEIPCHKVYEDEYTLAFLDIDPIQPGHTLVVPKKQVEFVWDLEDEDYQAVRATAKKVALRLREVMGRPYVGELVVGTDVPHAHIHLIPFSEAVQMKRFGPSGDEPDHAALAGVAAKLAF